jgi:hypothetical protein
LGIFDAKLSTSSEKVEMSSAESVKQSLLMKDCCDFEYGVVRYRDIPISHASYGRPGAVFHRNAADQSSYLTPQNGELDTTAPNFAVRNQSRDIARFQWEN